MSVPTRRRSKSPDLVTGALSLLLVSAATIAGFAFHLRLHGPPHFPGAPTTFGEWPVLAQWQPHLGPGTPLALLIAIATIAWGPPLAQRLPWRRALLSAYLLSLSWTLALALIDGWHQGIATRLTTRDEYVHAVPAITDIPTMLHTFTAHIVDGHPDSWITQVAAHPPAATLIFVWLDRLGLHGGTPAALLCVLAAATPTLTIPITISLLGHRPQARAILPFLAILPGAIWLGVSADALFTAITSAAIPLLTKGAQSLTRPRPHTQPPHSLLPTNPTHVASFTNSAHLASPPGPARAVPLTALSNPLSHIGSTCSRPHGQPTQPSPATIPAHAISPANPSQRVPRTDLAEPVAHIHPIHFLSEGQPAEPSPATIGARAVSSARGGIAACVGAGVLLGFGIFLSYGLVLMAPIALAVVWVTRGWRALVWAIGGALAVVAGFALAGFWWLDGYHLVLVRYGQSVAAFRPYGYWVWANLACLVLVIGPGAVAGLRRAVRGSGAVAGLRRAVRDSGISVVVGAAALAVLVADLSGLSKAEVERIWLPFAVWLVAGVALLPERSRRGWLASGAVLALLVNHLLLTNW